MTIIAAADGSALGNPGPAGWAWYVDDSCWAAGGWPHATNNQGELKAVLELFRATAHLDDDLHVLCDSQYVINSVTKWMPGWKKKGWRKADGKPVMNVELLREIDDALAGRRYRFEWVKGHANHTLNEAADARARAVAEAYQRRTTIPAGPGWSGGAGAPVTSPPAPARPPEPGGAPVTLFDEIAEHGALFDTASKAEPAREAGRTASVTLTLTLTDAEHARLTQRAARRGVSVEELLRELI
ncbi:ribbon-helix-helix protein, CopG family [Cryobacterium tepidiphilum]|uniref:ribonuclease H n=1 Tax=Cryobacterium tepidiphilum TaxID=2486026 RepID=A0A3M8LBU5_9MICO|nr:ribbon-helix-helix protein, CopG family [Cryobacterium tepidiphilum]